MNRANRQRAEQQLAIAAHEAAGRLGYAKIGQLVRDRCELGQSLAAISRDCGLSKDWLSRHLAQLDPAAAEFARASHGARLDGRWLPAVRARGFDDVASYLRQRHIADHASVNTIAIEVGLSFHTVKAALQRHQITVSPHAAKRHIRDSRTRKVAADLGVDSIANFVEERLAMGRTWHAIAAEAGQPESWLRRQRASRNSRTSA